MGGGGEYFQMRNLDVSHKTLEPKKDIAAHSSVKIEAEFKNHIYWFTDKLCHQMEGGAIWSRLIGVVTRKIKIGGPIG